METQRVFLEGKFEKHIMCFSDFSFRNTFCVSMGKPLWKSQNVSLNGFFQGKHHPAPAVLAGLYSFLLGSPARCAFLSYFMFIYMFRIPC